MSWLPLRACYFAPTVFWIWFLFILSHRQNWGQVGFLRNGPRTTPKGCGGHEKRWGPQPRMMPQYWTAHRSSLTRSLWPSEAHIVGTGSPNDAPNDAQSDGAALAKHTLGLSARRISKPHAVRPQPKKAQEEQGAAEDMTKHRTIRLCRDSASFVRY